MSLSLFLLVGVAAMAGAAGEYLGNVGTLDAGTLGAIYLAVFIGGITFTGSIVAFSKLAGMMSSKALALPVRDQLNLGMISALAIGMTFFLDPGLGSAIGFDGLDQETLQLSSLSLAAVISSILGFHLVASIGGPDMPVVVTVLNSYSGWALVAGKSNRVITTRLFPSSL
jgi:NAD(P) transhydrogenase